MAKTFPFKQMSVNLDDDVYESGSKWTYDHEAASQTFLKKYPLETDANGQVVVWTEGAALISHFAMQDATGVTNALIKAIDAPTVLALGGLEANLLVTSTAATRVYDGPTDPAGASDLFNAVELELDGTTGFWFFGGVVTGHVLLWDDLTEHLFSNEDTNRAIDGDSDVRLYAKLAAATVQH